MHLDEQDLRNFYYRRALGRAAQVSLRARRTQSWPEAKGQTVAGVGFAIPLLRPYLADARRVIALMPGPQGVMPWPANAPNVSVLTEETLWPIETGQVDKLIMLHGLETSERAFDLLEEAWRVLGPVGVGRPYSASQLETQLRKHQFLPERHLGARYQFPSSKRVWMKSGPMFEKVGRSMPGIFAGGAFMVEASKLVYPPKGKVARSKARKQAIPQGVPAPIAGRV